MNKIFWPVIAAIRKVAVFVVVISFSYMVLAVLAQVVGRYLFNYSISWSEETARFAQIWIVMIGAGITMRRGLHVAVDTLATYLPLNLARALKILIVAACLWFLGVVIYASIPQIQLGWTIELSPVLQLPMWMIYICVPIGAAYWALEVVLSTVERWNQPFGTIQSDDLGTTE